MTVNNFFERNKDYKPWVIIRDYLSGEYLYEGWVLSIPNEIGDKAIYRWHCVEYVDDIVAKYEIYTKE